MSSAEDIATLGWADYVVIGVMLAISASIGIYYRFTGGRQKTTEEYFSANRSMSIAPLSLALMVSFMSAITLLGISSENYMYGTQIIALYVGYTLGTPASLYLYLPVFFKLQTMSAYEYLEMRFGVGARLLASIANSLQLLLYTGVVLYAPALALEATTGLPGDISVLLIGIICTFYSTVGGIKAVLITDVFQGILMFVAVIMIIIFGAINVEGGIAGIWQKALDGERIEIDNISPDPTMRHTWWSLTIGGFCTFLTLYGVNQVQVQRLLTVKTLSAAKMAMWGNWPFLTLLGVLTSFSGLAMYAYFADCDPLTAGQISASDMLMPYFVMKTMGHIPGLAGLFIAGIFSAGLSTVSAMLNSLAAVALEDYVKPTYVKLGSQFPEKHGTLVGKIFAVVIGLLCLAVAYIAKNMGSLIQASLSITGAIGGPLLGIFTLGMFFESAEEIGSVVGTVISLALMCWTAFGQPRPAKVALAMSTSGCSANVTTVSLSTVRQVAVGDSSSFYLYRISYMWYAPLGLVVSVVVGLAVSSLVHLVRKKHLPELNPDLFTPLVAKRIRRRRVDVTKTTNSQIFTLQTQKSDNELAHVG
ncbi:putative sodium-dependent multivitamin transporter isoform X1 [Neodiprion pinetum]|uniref:Sodium-dependent multivitamin transporter isoform X1 n=3 Tax=Neodiprion lecontei TaxID=441921 RepID=A0A6J0BTL6_NEOLC|nr:putative sodium-dependent multivitamin transporter isoform X1 [Neodiprion lecontei]XP_046469841.1 putative sodium-dependent multivitamin transporter isoform X1 [Neodiprion pinetum]XP_046606966.1 putative sodium-dependent multivitamin transporter isoform X1 [Neodiprion virginianus]